MGKYDEAAFNAQLNENMADDPYGTAMFLIGEALKASLDNEAQSEDEVKILRRIARIYVEADRYAACPMCGMHARVGHSERPRGYIVFDDGDVENGPRPDGPDVAPCYICNFKEAQEEGWEE